MADWSTGWSPETSTWRGDGPCPSGATRLRLLMEDVSERTRLGGMQHFTVERMAELWCIVRQLESD